MSARPGGAKRPRGSAAGRAPRAADAPAARKAGGGKAPAEAEPEGQTSRRTVLLLGAAVVLAHVLLALGAFNPAPHTGGDNAGYITLARSLLTTGSYTELWDPLTPAHTKYPPVFPALLALWMLLGAKTWAALKGVPMLFSALSVLFAYLWAAGRRGPTFGAAVALLVGVSSASIDASHWVLSDPPFVAFTLLALWAFDRADVGEESDASTHPPCATALLLLGCAAALLAYFTRSAGLPLLAAVAIRIATSRRWRALAAYAAGAGAPLLLWWLRTRRVGQATYMNEFWLVDPYDPSLGRVGVGGLIGRLGENGIGYLTRHIPGGIVGAQGAWVAALGVLLVGLAVWGWARRVTHRPGVAEWFVPLYLGLILLWPAVWSGDRFALPLYALLFFYAGDALYAFTSRAGRAAAAGAAVAAFLVLAAPAFGAWTRSVSVARICASAARQVGPFGCWGAGVDEFVRMAMWSRTALPEGSSVLSRKPRIFYVMSGVPSRTFPFSIDPEVLFAEARATGARYLVIDQWDQQALRFMGEVLARRPESFCSVGGFDPREGSAGTLMLGILLDRPPPASDLPPTEISLERCPEEMLADAARAPIPRYSSSRVPLVELPPPEP